MRDFIYCVFTLRSVWSLWRQQVNITVVCHVLWHQLQLKRCRCNTRTRRSQLSQECKDPRRQRFCDSCLLTFSPPNRWFRWLMVEHFYVKFGDCLRYPPNEQTHRQTKITTVPPLLPWAWLIIMRCWRLEFEVFTENISTTCINDRVLFLAFIHAYVVYCLRIPSLIRNELE